MDAFLKWFWNEEFWLPKGVKFADFQNTADAIYAKPYEVYFMLGYAILLLCLRFCFEKLVANPLATKLGIENRIRTPPKKNVQLEAFYKTCKSPSDLQVAGAAKKADLEVKQVMRWLRRRRNADRSNLRKKFAEASWRCFFYLCIFTFGMSILLRAPWFWDGLESWKGYPQPMWTSVYYYYMLEGGFYISLLFSVMRDVKRKDFYQQLIHHMATLILIVFSYSLNFVRVGTLVMAVHDVSDIFLEAAKSASYAKKPKLADALFTIFAVVFFISRLGIMPYSVVHTTWIKMAAVLQPFPSYYMLNSTFFVLQSLHIFWATIIVRMAIRMWKSGGVEKDDRSDMEELSSEEEKNCEKKSNGHYCRDTVPNGH
uniref:LAG1-like3 n=1 Tax=Phallusia mammillata TaxID=59560 RepID=A0A6F9D9N3_9ASCI|nr:LAG1-like3 [Phallusia mammillata]